MTRPMANDEIAKLVAEARRPPTQEDVDRLTRALVPFEKAHGCTTAEMQERIADGRMHETADVCRWLMLAELHERVRRRLAVNDLARMGQEDFPEEY